MKKVQISIIIALFFCVFGIVESNAQLITNKEKNIIAKQAIKDLEGGTLILRLKSKHNKISKLEELLENPNLKESTQLRLNNELKETIDERNKFNISIVKAFEEYYDFSEIYYMYDTSSVALKNGRKNGIFLNENLELDPSISIPEKPFFIIKSGTTDSSTTTGLAAMVIMDQELKDLADPFPYYIRINSVGRLLSRIFNHKHIVKRDSEVIVKRLVAKLRNYAALVSAG